MSHMPPRIIRKVKRHQRIHLQDPAPLVHPTIDGLVKPFVEILDSHRRERGHRYARVLVSRLPRDLLALRRLVTKPLSV